jgi:hypothetical protein
LIQRTWDLDSIVARTLLVAEFFDSIGQEPTPQQALDLVSFVPCVDGSLLARVFSEGDALLVGAAMCPAC